jgi:hypothetical protein
MKRDLSRKHKIMRERIIDRGTSPKEYVDGQAAMHNSTGKLTNVKKQCEPTT